MKNQALQSLQSPEGYNAACHARSGRRARSPKDTHDTTEEGNGTSDALALDVDDGCPMEQTIDNGAGGHGIGEHLSPVPKSPVAREDDRALTEAEGCG